MHNTHQQRVTTTPRRLTQAVVREYLRRLGGTIRRTDYDDFRVRLEGCEYFTTDLDDVVGTARVMCGGMGLQFELAEQYLAEQLNCCRYCGILGCTVDHTDEFKAANEEEN